LHCFTHLLIALALALAGALAAQEQTPAPAARAAAPAPTAALHGHIADPTGALIPGAAITIVPATGTAAVTTTSDANGAYVVNGLAPGSYIVQVSVAGFAPFVSPAIPLAAGQTKRVEISMAIEAAQQQVVVSGEAEPAVSTEASANTNAIVLKGKDLDALSDDPNELSDELQALAGPAAGPNGGQIYIDGFTGGQLPPKSAIREIRINQNPFSSQFDKLGYGRIEILTKPGSDKLHGRFFGMGNDSAFNTLNPFTSQVPSYHSYMLNGTVSGPLSKWASFFFSMEERNSQNDSIYTAQTANLDSTTGVYFVPTVGGNQSNIVPEAGGLFGTTTHTNISPRIDLQLGQKNTLTLRYQFYRNNETNNLSGSTSLPTQANSTDSIEHTIQLDDTQIINDHLVNETRFEYRRANTTTTPVSTAPSISVAGYFASGGSSAQSAVSHMDHYELQNITTLSAGTHAIKFGTWLRDNREALSTDANYNGSFIFATPYDYAGALNLLHTGTACPTTPSSSDIACGTTNAPINLTYTSGNEAFQGNVFDASLYFQDDWTVNPFLTLSGGLRWESQNHIADHNDWAPRFAFAYALDGHRKGTAQKTVVRGGYGFFYDRFQTASLMNLEQFNGGPRSQTQITIASPTCFTDASLSSIPGGLASCGTAKAHTPEIYQISSNYRSPDTEMLGLSVERQLTKVSTLTLTYLHSYGVHQLVTRDSNAYLPGTFLYGSSTLTGVRPDSSLGIVEQYYPEAVFKENQLILNLNDRFSPNFSLMGFYNASWANSDGGGGSNPSNSYKLMQDYGRASFVHPQWLFLMASYTGPWGITFNPFLIAEAGKPFNITSQYDLTGDSFFNDRPSYAGASATPSNVAQTSFGALDVVPQAGEAILPFDLGNSPASVAVNLRVGRTIGFGPKLVAGNAGAPPPGGGGHHGGPGGPFGGGGGRGGMFGPTGSGRKYSLTFNAQALNLFNDINYGTPSGSVVPTQISGSSQYGPGSLFDKSTSLAGGIFSSPTSAAARRIFFQAVFSF
jgi:hypothetical protein